MAEDPGCLGSAVTPGEGRMQELSGSLRWVCAGLLLRPRATGLLEEAAESSPFYLVAFCSRGRILLLVTLEQSQGDAAVVVLRLVQVTRRNPSRGLPSLRFGPSGPSPALPEPPSHPR